jgi:hypothetical protein
MQAQPTSGRRFIDRLPMLFALLLFAYSAGVVLWHEELPLLGDLSNWIYGGTIFARKLHGIADLKHTFKLYPVPNSFLIVILALITAVSSPLIAVKSVLVSYFALSFVAIRVLARAVGTSSRIWWIAPGFFLSVNLYWGFLGFQFGVLWLMLFLAVMVQDLQMEPSQARLWSMHGLLILLFFTHMVPFTFACLLVLFYALQTQRPNLFKLYVIPGLLLAGYVVGRLLGGNIDSTSMLPEPPVSALHTAVFKVNTFCKSFGFVNPVKSDGASQALATLGKPLFLLLFCAAITAAISLAVVYVRAILLRDSIQRFSFVWLAAAMSLPVYLFLPHSMLGISDPGSRILQTVLWPALFFCMGRAKGAVAWQRVASICCAMMAVGGALILPTAPWSFVGDHRRTLPDAIEGFATAPHGYGAIYLDQLRQGKWGVGVFPTSIFLNHNAPRPDIGESLEKGP